MGHYRKKPYKRKSLDYYHEKQAYEEIQIELVDVFKEEKDEDIFSYEDEEILFFSEPDIVKELREEERLGRLTMMITDPPLKNIYSMEPEKKPIAVDYALIDRPRSVEEAYKLARKALDNLH